MKCKMLREKGKKWHKAGEKWSENRNRHIKAKATQVNQDLKFIQGNQMLHDYYLQCLQSLTLGKTIERSSLEKKRIQGILFAIEETKKFAAENNISWWF